MAGLDVERVLTERDPFRRTIDQAVIERWQKLASEYREDVANRFAAKFG